MRKGMWSALAACAILLAFPAAGVSKAHGGTLNMIAWEGYTQAQWVKPFVKSTGCTIHPKYAGSPGEMVTLMRSGGGSQYDMVSASGDASLRLIYGKDVQPVDVSKIPSFKDAHAMHLDGIVSPATADLLNSSPDDATRWMILLASPEFQLK